ncbi:ACP S-malonyltransferase [uncultured Helicobacter sp.]|uniref:ACP S-malonyltransferase n=1 Tax=uncultured Helicobacter sp. TaxID=175537 RepID=UPI00374F8B55
MKKYAFIFPGQGSQSVGMGKEFYENFTLAKELFDEASEAIKLDMKDLLFNPNDNLNLTQYTQPAIFLISYIAHSVLQQEHPLMPSLAFGHSLGEVSAFVVANGAEFSDGMRLVHTRGALMAKACEGQDAGMMVVVGVEDSALEEFCRQAQSSGKKIWCANYNGDGQVVLAGKKSDLSACESEIKALGAKRALLLPMSVASHCPMLEPILSEFGALLEESLSGDASVPILSNATLQTYQSKQEAKELLSKQLIAPVLYKQSVLKIDSQVDGYIEFGNGNVLKGLNKRLSQKPTYNVSNLATLKETLESL